MQASQWALSKAGCSYSQARRTQENVFDCSSLVARAYIAQGKTWIYGGPVPISSNEVYDDEFQLLWPEDYTMIGKNFGGRDVINLGTQAGDLQFICTDSGTNRSNRITHVAMVSSSTRIVHARSTKYGVRTDPISQYTGKICAIIRYDPACDLRIGMRGRRTLALQKAVNACGSNINEDAEFGSSTRNAVAAWQKEHGLPETGIADTVTQCRLGLLIPNSEQQVPTTETGRAVRVTGKTVNVRTGPGIQYESAFIAHENELLTKADVTGWLAIEHDGKIYWISDQYILQQGNNE